MKVNVIKTNKINIQDNGFVIKTESWSHAT